MLRQLDLTPPDLTALAVTTGRGSFTGVRIAVSAAKGIGLGLPQPVASIGLPALNVTAASWREAAQSADAQVWVYLQAGRGRFNWHAGLLESIKQGDNETDITGQIRHICHEVSPFSFSNDRRTLSG